MATAFVKVRGDASGLVSDLTGGLGMALAAVAKWATGISVIVGAIGIGVSIAKLVQLSRESVSLARIQENAEARIKGVVQATGMAAGYTAKQLMVTASALQEASTFGDEEILDAMSLMLTFKKIQGEVFDRGITTAMDLSAVMGTGVKVSVMMLAKALEDPARRMSALSRAGVSFTKEEEERVKALQKSGDLYGAQVIVLEAVEGQVKGVAKALSMSDAGQLQQAENTLGDMKEEIGRDLIPFWTVWTKLQIGWVRAMHNVLGPFGQMISGMGELDSVVGASERAFSRFFDAFSRIKDTILLLITRTMEWFGFVDKGATDIPTMIGDAFASVLDIVSSTVEKIGKWFQIMVENWDLSWSAMKDILQGSGQFLLDVLGKLRDNFGMIMSEMFANFVIVAGKAIDGVIESFKNVDWAGLAEQIGGIINSIIEGESAADKEDRLRKAHFRTIGSGPQGLAATRKDFMKSIGLEKTDSVFEDLFAVTPEVQKHFDRAKGKIEELKGLIGKKEEEEALQEAIRIGQDYFGFSQLNSTAALASNQKSSDGATIGAAIAEQLTSERLGFAQLGTKIQDQLLGAKDPALEEAKKQTKLMEDSKKVAEETRDGLADLDAPVMGA